MRAVHIDVANLAFRSHYKVPNLSWNGRLTGAIFESLKGILMLRREYSDAQIICAFDSRSDNRHEQVKEAIQEGVFTPDEGYKGHRDRGNPDYKAVISQMDELLSLLKGTGIQCVKVPGAEADDIIGSYCRQYPDVDHIIFSSDRDFYQLICEKVKVLDPTKKVEITTEGIRERFGLDPLQLIDVGAFSGDPSDNIPGVDGVGEKRSLALIQEFGSIEGVLRGLKEKKDLGSKMRAFENSVLQSEQKLMTCRSLKRIDTGISIPPISPFVAYDSADKERVEKYIVESLGCVSLVPQVGFLFPEPREVPLLAEGPAKL